MRKTARSFVDITGQQFGFWKILERVENRYLKVHYRCLCICGRVGIVGKQQLTRGSSTNCGCITRKTYRGDNEKWGKRWTPEEDQRIREWYPINGAIPVAKFLGRTQQSVRGRAERLGVQTNKPIYPRKDKWSEGELNKLKELWPKGGYEACYKELRFRTKQAIKDKAHALKLRIEGRKQNVKRAA